MKEYELHPPRKQRERGFSMIEILVTLVIISFGLLGVAAIQMTSLKNASSSQYRAQANSMAYDILDRMRSNRRLAYNGSFDTALSTAAISGSCAGQSAIQSRDLCEWKQAIEARLPAGQGSIAFSRATGAVAINIQWDDTRGQNGSSTQTFLVSSQLCDPAGNTCQ